MTDEHQADLRPWSVFGRLAGLSCAAVVTAGAIASYPVRTLAGSGALVALVLGAGIALVAALLGLVPMVLSLRHGPRGRVQGLLGGMVLRFLLTIALLLTLLALRPADRVTLAVSTVAGYLLLLVVDTGGVAWLSRRQGRTSS